MAELQEAVSDIDRESELGRKAAERLTLDWDNREWIPLSPSYEWARSAIECLGEVIANTAPMIRASIKGAERGASTLSPRPFQGIVECLQNADDLGASSLRIVYRSEPRAELLIVHDGSPVTLANVGAMLLPWLSTKSSDADASGRFGIGQRTLGSLGGPITVHASPFHFVMDEDGPIVIEPSSDVEGVYQGDRRDTMLSIPLVEGVTSRDIADAVSELGTDSLIFLRSIRSLHYQNLEDSSLNLAFVVQVTPQQSGLINFDDETAVVDIADVEVVLPVALAQSYRRYSTRRTVQSSETRSNKATGASTPIGVCVPMHELFQPQRLYDRMPLPVITGLPLGLNAQFDPDAGRSTLLPNHWNRNRFADLGQLVAWAALQAFQAGDVMAWNHVPLMAEVSIDERWTADRIHELIVDACQSILREQLTLRVGSGATSVNEIAYEAKELEDLLNEEDIELLVEDKVALPRYIRDFSGRWRLVLGELDCSEIVDVETALDVLDGKPERGVDWYVRFAVIAQQHGLFSSFILRPSLILADGSSTQPPERTDIWVLVKTLSPSALSTRLNLAHQLHPAYFDDETETSAFLAMLRNHGILFEDRDAVTDVFTIFERGAYSLEDLAPIKLDDEELLELRDAWARIPHDRHADLGRKVGQLIELKATWYDPGGKSVDGWARPAEMYLPAAIDREVDSFAKAAGHTPGLKWVNKEYAKVLKQAAGRSAIGAQRLLSSWGVAREPRLIPPSDERPRYTRDQTPASAIGAIARTAEQLQSIRAGGSYTHLLEDHWSPDADSVAADIACAPAKKRKGRGVALLATLSRAWERRYSDSAIAVAATAYNGYWTRGIEVRATWLARLADIKWMPDANGGLQRPSDLQIQIPGSPPKPNERSTTIAKLDPHIQRSGILSALGVKAGPTQRDLIASLRALRDAPITDGNAAQALMLYQLLAASLSNKNDGHPDGRMTTAQLKNAFRANVGGAGLLIVRGEWRSPESLLRGPAIFAGRRIFAPHVEGLDVLWSVLGIEFPAARDAISVLKEIAGGPPSPQDLGIAIRALTLIAGNIPEMSPQMRATLRRLPLWTGAEWTTERPAYVFEGESLLASAPSNMRVWKPGITSFTAISALLEPLGVVRLRSSDFRPASIPAYGTQGNSISETFGRAVALLRQELVRADQALLDSLLIDWDQLIAAPVIVDPDLVIVAELTHSKVILAAQAHVCREPLCLVIRALTEAGTAEGAGAAIGSLFDGDRQKIAWAWAAVWPRAAAGEQADGAVLPNTRPERGSGKERLEELAKQAGRRKGTTTPGKVAPKADSHSQPVQVRKLRDLDELEPSVGAIVNEGAKPAGDLVFAKRRKPNGTRIFDPNIESGGGNTSVTQRTVLPPSSERERMALDVVRRALRLDAQQLNDLRNARGVGVDAIDELRQCYEIKMSSDSAIPNDITLTASEVEAAKNDPDFFLAIVSGLEEGAGKLRVRFIFDPLTQLDVRVRNDITLTGVSRAEALEFEFDKA